MAKRDADIDPIDDQPVEAEVATVGERLRTAREANKLSLEDVAAQTRIPLRHLESIESGQWDSLPAATYTIGFAKSYASVVGLDRVEIGDQLREEMGGQRFASTSPDVFEAADPARTMPKWLVLGAILAVVLLVVIMTWWNKRSLEQPDQSPGNSAAAALPTAQTPATQPLANQAQAPVVLTAVAPVWLQVSEKSGAPLFTGVLQPGQTYAVPATASAPVLKTGKPEALKISVGNAVVAPVGPPATTVDNVSLLGRDLLRGPASPAPAKPAFAPPVAEPPRRRTSHSVPPRPTPATTPASEPTTPTTNTAQ